MTRIIWDTIRSEEHTSELQSQSTISYAGFCLKQKKKKKNKKTEEEIIVAYSKREEVTEKTGRESWTVSQRPNLKTQL